MEYLVAVSSRDQVMIHQHFGHTEDFLIFKIVDNEKYVLYEHRPVEAVCNGGEHDNNRLAAVITLLSDCKYVLSAKIGEGVQEALRRQGVTPLEIAHFINYAMEKVMIYDKRKSRNQKKE